MYNRYLRNDEGVYTRLPMPETPPEEPRRTPPPPPRRDDAPPPPPPPREDGAHGARAGGQLLERLLDKLPLKDVDKGDLLLLLMLFFLFEEKADDELLIALGLLLIL